MKKLVPVSGDIMYDNLGVDPKVLEQIYNEVNIGEVHKCNIDVILFIL